MTDVQVQAGQQAGDLERRTQILDEAIKLFARRGYEAVSMRELARAVGITPAALYHHFPNKKELHRCALEHAFHGRAQPAMDMLDPRSGPPVERLRNFIHRLCERFCYDVEFRMLLQRERLDQATDDSQARVAGVFRGAIAALQDLLGELAPDFDRHMLANSIFALVIHIYETEHRRRFLPNYRAELSEPDRATNHIMHLLLHGILPKRN